MTKKIIKFPRSRYPELYDKNGDFMEPVRKDMYDNLSKANADVDHNDKMRNMFFKDSTQKISSGTANSTPKTKKKK